jgi:hypothetical protein
MDHGFLNTVVIGGLVVIGLIHFAKFFVIDVGEQLGELYRWFKKWRSML